MILDKETKFKLVKFQSALEDREEELGWSNSQIYEHIQKGHPWIVHVEKGEARAFILYVETDRVIEVTYTETLKDHRGKGQMYGLFSNLISGYSEKLFWLDVHEGNVPARRLYQKLGFKNNGLRKGYYRDGGDCLLLERPASL